MFLNPLQNNGGTCFFNSLYQCINIFNLPKPDLQELVKKNNNLSGGNNCFEEAFYDYVELNTLEKYFTIYHRDGSTDIVYRIANNTPDWIPTFRETVEKFSAIIVISLDRYTLGFGTVINYPNILDIPDYYKYKLVAVARYSGNGTGGHWWADVLSNDQVYTCNDSSITPGSLEARGDSTILFYKAEVDI